MKKILVIDDDVVMRTFVTHTLTQAGFETFEADDGASGVELGRLHRPDLIITDVIMEGMDGYKALAALREDPATAAIPVVLMTSIADTAGMRQGMELGADDYLPKPVSKTTLLAVIEVQNRKRATFRKRAEQSLQQLRSNLIRTLPHELNTPLNGILGFAEILATSADSVTPKEIVEMANYISISANRLHRVARNYLAYARTEMLETDPAASARLRESRTENAVDVVTQICQTVAASFDRSADLKLDLVPSAALAIEMEDLRQIADEMVQNACKFSKSGTTISVTMRPKLNGFALSFADRGRGIKPENIQNIEAYSQFEREVHAHEGLGLGLIITKRLTRIYQGTFQLESIPGTGTTVTVNLPSAD